MKTIGLTLALLAFAAGAQAKKKWDVPCQKVFVTGTQTHEIAWALKGGGLKNNLYAHTCLEPVPKASDATAILDLEWDPNYNPMTVSGAEQQRLAEREQALESPDYSVTCASTLSGSTCTDSTGTIVGTTTCDASGCVSTYGSSNVVEDLLMILSGHFAASTAWGYLFSKDDHHLLWKYTSLTAWWGDLARYAKCPNGRRFNQSCKAPKSLLN